MHMFESAIAWMQIDDSPEWKELGHDIITLCLNKFIDKKTGTAIPLDRQDPNYDYGLLLRIHPSQHEKRVWVVCDGFGEWGTSGVAWFLAHRWRQIFWKTFRKRDFALIIRTRRGQDESAEIVWP